MPSFRPGLRRHLLVLLLYTLLSLLLTYPLVTRFTTHVPGDGIDDPALAWNLWWVKTSLVDRQINPFAGQWMFYPIGINLAFYTLTLLNGLLSVPLQTALGLVTASNLLLLSSFVLSGYGAYLLATHVLVSSVTGQGSSVTGQGSGARGCGSAAQRQEQGGQRSQPASSFITHHSSFIITAAAFLAGLLYAFSSSKMFYAALGQFNIASSQWIPFAVLYIMRSCSEPVRRPARTNAAERSTPETGRAGLREPLLAALFMLLQAYAELTYASFLVIFIALHAGYRLIQIGRPKDQQISKSANQQIGTSALAHLVRNLLVIAAVFLIGLAPALANMLPDMRAEGDFLVEGGGFADVYSADLAGFALPTQLHPLLGGIVRQAAADSQLRPDGSQWQVDKGQHLTLGLVGLALAVAGLWTARRRPGAWFWATSALVFFLLSLGPALRIAGHSTGIPGPFAILQELPFFKGNRYPSRFSAMLLVSVVPLVAWGVQWVLGQVATRWQNRQLATAASQGVAETTAGGAEPVAAHRSAGTKGSLTKPGGRVTRRVWPVAGAAALIAVLLIFENLSIPLPMSDMRVPSIYDAIAAAPGDFAILDLPLGWRNGFSVFGKQDLVIMAEQWAQTRHGKPILGGNTSRNPEQKFRYFLEAPLIGPLTVLANATDANPHIRDQLAGALAALRSGDASLGGNAMLQEAAADAPEVLRRLNTRYVVVHRDRVPPEFVTFVETYFPVKRLAEEGENVLYSVDLPPAPAELTVRPAQDPLSRGEGWSGLGQVRVDDAGDAPALWAQRENTRLLLPPVKPGPYRLTVRAAAAGPGQTLALEVNGYETPAQPLPADRSVLTFDLPAGALNESANEVVLRFGQTFPVDDALRPGLLVESAGLEAGNNGHIWLDGRDISPNSRGYNLAILDGKTWQPRAVASFDTHLDPSASQRMVEFLHQFDADSVLAVAVKDTAADQLGAEAAQTLTALGLTDLRGRLRWGQAAIVLGANVAGSGQKVFERVSGLQPVSVGWGPGWREPRAAAQVEWVGAERIGD